MVRDTPQLIVFSYHKTGTSLFLHVMTKVSEILGLSLVTRFGRVERLEPEPDIVLLPHSMLRAAPAWPTRAIRLIRDPRDIWVSGYLYHQHCDEDWCISTDFDLTPPIGWPRVDHSLAHLPEAAKREWLERLGGRSYQQNLLDRSRDDGLAFELAGYTGHTLAAMRAWDTLGLAVLDVKLEDLMADFDGGMRRVFEHFGFSPDRVEVALALARSEDVNRMDDQALAARPQVHSRTISKWRAFLSPEQVAAFEAAHGELIEALGYPRGVAPPGQPEAGDADAWFASPDAALTTEAGAVDLVWPGLAGDVAEVAPVASRRAAEEVRLCVDGLTVRPTVSTGAAYHFVVPPGARHVVLKSPFTVVADPAAPYLAPPLRLGMRVSEIDIRARSSEVVIPADDPRLVRGWHKAERSGRVLWRWTDGAADVPWDGVVGPAMVVVRCMPSSEPLAWNDGTAAAARGADWAVGGPR